MKNKKIKSEDEININYLIKKRLIRKKCDKLKILGKGDLKNKLKIIPIINKIDLPNSNITKTTLEITNLLNMEKKNIILCSGKTGFGINLLLEEIAKKIPPPLFYETKESKAIIFDSWFD
ncbi:MAG: hypothetical protein QGG87_07215, partial [Nitrospinota bacterium]|nr:hypothetical protein [Nitrospinota bacterium]